MKTEYQQIIKDSYNENCNKSYKEVLDNCIFEVDLDEVNIEVSFSKN